MKIDIAGQEHEFDFDTITLNEGIKVQQRTGALMPDFRPALASGDALAWKALCVMILERVGSVGDYDTWDEKYEAIGVVPEAPKVADASDPSEPPVSSDEESPTT